jgi:hypothetical protein
MDNIRQWQTMNPGIEFIITTVAEEEEKAAIAEITEGFEVVYIEEPIVQWCKHEMKRLGVAIHFLSDVMRWFCLDAIKDRGEKVFLIEADVVCLKENWMMEYPPTEALTLFGTDRACALFCPYKRAIASLIDLVTFYRNVYEYLIEENIFVGNFDHLMMGNVDENLNDAYRKIIAKPKEERSTEEDELNYLNSIPHGLLGIGQRHFFDIHLQDGVEDVMYMHLKNQDWRKRKTKRKRGGQNKTGKYGCKRSKSRKNGQNVSSKGRYRERNW